MKVKSEVLNVILKNIWETTIDRHICKIKFEIKGNQVIVLNANNDSILGVAPKEDINIDLREDSVVMYGEHETWKE